MEFGPLLGVPITELRIEGLRTIEKIRLKLDQLTVLIGENGSGKSSIIEACEILRRVTGPRFLEELYGIHGGLTSLLRQGASRLVMGVTVRPERNVSDEMLPPSAEAPEHKRLEIIEYDLALVPSGSFAMIEESLRIRPLSSESKPPPSSTKPKARPGSKRPSSKRPPDSGCFIRRVGGKIDISRGEGAVADKIDEQTTFLSTLGINAPTESPHHEAQYVAAHLRNARIQLPFEVMPIWAERAHGRTSALRAPSFYAPADHLEMLGMNLANAFHALRNNFGQEHWKETLDSVRLGLGDRIEDVVTWADPSGGPINFAIKQKGVARQIPAVQLSDGMLAYLAFVALYRLWATQPSLLAVDEPDLHLHPRVLSRVIEFFSSMARDFPLIVATHSDRLLDAIPDPARSVVLCDLGPGFATRLVRPDRAALEKWLQRYRGVGDLRAAGHAGSVFTLIDPT